MSWNLFDTHRKKRIDPADVAITGTLKCALVASTYTPDQNLHDFFSDITNEVTGTNYTAGGNACTGIIITLSVAGLVTFDANDPATWLQSGAGFSTARRAILYWDTGVAATSRLLAYSDAFAADYGNVTGDFSVQMDAAGVFTSAR